jgi:protein-S-isoprenylcysteine O-methyltransferase Ste14
MKDHARVYLPPPLIYAAVFFLSILIQKFIVLPKELFELTVTKILGWLFIAGQIISVMAYMEFHKAKTTASTMRPVTSLQTKGLYTVSRNPMYIGLLLTYIGIALLVGNWWTIILIPLLIIIMNLYVIQREENYLERTFGKEYLDYKKRVRRWI